jgi:uncharacterized protein (DUF1800 family)
MRAASAALEVRLAYDKDLFGAIAANRLGLGAKAGEIAAAGKEPHGWLIAQIRPAGADQIDPSMPSSAQRFDEYRAYQKARREAQAEGDAARDPVKMARDLIRRDTGADLAARLQLAAATDASFRERWALFWANHFTVSAVKVVTATLIGPFEQEAIRPHAFGRFEDMLVASSSHPAMLLYLDQARSFGPDTRAARYLEMTGDHAGLNENLAREILELHTVGVESGYTQADVTEFARAMTGWSIGGSKDGDQAGCFYFRDNAHEPGPRLIMGKRYPEAGIDQARWVMRDLAASPHTAHHLATKIARHFVADDPSPALVARLETAYLGSGGDLGVVAKTLVQAPETWAPDAAKFKTPYEFLVSAWRASGARPGDVAEVARAMAAMGQRPLAAPSPKGWPDETGAWLDPDGLVKRMAWSETFAAGAIGERDPLELAGNALGPRLGPLASNTIARAETRAEGLSILLMSPEFQRR